MKEKKLKYKSYMNIKYPRSVKQIKNFKNPVRKSSDNHESAKYLGLRIL